MFDALQALDRHIFAISRIWMPFILAAWLWLLFGRGGKHRALALVLLVGVGLTDVVNSRLLKPLFGRKRPCVVEKNCWLPMGIKTSKSFPSSHAANAGAFAGIILLEAGPAIGAPFLALAAAVAYSRVYVGVHYPLDVAAGLVVGFLMAWSAVSLRRHYWPRNPASGGSTVAPTKTGPPAEPPAGEPDPAPPAERTPDA